VPSASPPLLPGAVSRLAIARAWLTRSFTGLTLLVGIVAKLLAATITAIAGERAAAVAIDTLGDLALLVAATLLIVRLFRDARRRLLWRVRRKLTLSYIFIGVVPALLIVCFFIISGMLVVLNVSSFIVRTRLADIVDEARAIAEIASVDLADARTPAEVRTILERRQMAVAVRYPAVSYALVPIATPCSGQPAPWEGTVTSERAGGWQHTEPPTQLPAWLTCAGYAGLVVYTDRVTDPKADALRHTSARAVVPLGAAPGHVVLVDIPLVGSLADRLRADVGVVLGSVVRTPGSENIYFAQSANEAERSGGFLTREFEGVGQMDSVDWDTGEPFQLWLPIRTSLAEVYNRVDPGRIGQFSLGQALLYIMAFIAALFLVILLVAFGMGLALARSITGSVHELFAGTERVRQGDFSHKISITSQDQLGELADSFNSMTSSIEDLLQQKAEKERLEQELRIARQIQMSLLPQGSLVVPGVSLTAHCEPAREVGGDYYDFLPIDEHRVGILIADVSGKGTSAALYMAELKGIVLSLSQQHLSPRRLLIDANRIISRHLDSRSFITVCYAVMDLQARTLTYARAGHCPLIYRPGSYCAARDPQVLTPDGMVLGLQIDDGSLFNRLLEEAIIPLGAGDVFLLYTDGITEAMNDVGECFGDQRLAQLVHDHGDGDSDDLRERIVSEVRTFAGGASQQDDMTLVLLKMDGVPA
jgi:sigma-B regulation protein RsbU (phosphoserine phosphatase)